MAKSIEDTLNTGHLPIKTRIFYIVNTVLLVAALALTLSVIGKELPTPFHFYNTWDRPTLVSKDNKSVVVDNYYKHVNVLDDNWKILAQNSISGTDFNIDRISSVCINGDDVYIAGISFNDKRDAIESEKIIRCNIYGEAQEVVCNLDNHFDDNTWHIAQMSIDGMLQFCVRDKNNVYVYRVNGDKNKQIASMTVDYEIVNASYRGTKFAVNDIYGNLYVSENGAVNKHSLDFFPSSIVIDDDGCIYLDNEDNGTIYKLDGSNFAQVDMQGNLLLDASRSQIVDVGEGAYLNWFYALKIIARWLAFAYLFLVIIYLTVKIIKRERKLVRKGLLNLTTASVAVIVSIFLVAVFYTNYLKDNAFNTAYEDTQIEANVSKVCADTNLDDDYVSNIKKLTFIPDMQIAEMDNAGKHMFYHVYIYDDEKKSYSLVATSNRSFNPNYSIANENQGITTDNSGQYLYSVSYVNDANDKPLGAYMYGMYLDQINSGYLKDVGILSVTLLVICLIIFAALIEINNLADVARKYKKKLSKKSKVAYAYLVRPMSFLLSLAMGADSVLAVLIARDFLEGYDTEFIDAMSGIPITAAAVGLMIGILLFMRLENRYCVKSIFISSSVFLFFAYLLTAYSCIEASFAMFAVAKFLCGFATGVIRAELYSMAAAEKNEKKRKPLTQSIGRAAMPAQVFATLISGYIAIKFGYPVIYIFACLAAISCFVLGMILLPKKTYFLKKVIENKLSLGKIFKWAFSPRILVVIVFVMLPYAAVKGYKSFLFPLYSSSVGMDKMTISLIFALATMVTYIVIHPISDMNNRFENRTKIINGLLALGFVFVLFKANSRIEWAVTVMFLSMIIGRTFGTAFRMLLMRQTEYNGYDIGQLQPVMYFIEETCNALQVVFFSCILGFGSGMACVVFGIFCLISAIIFGVVSYNSPMRDSWLKEHKNDV